MFTPLDRRIMHELQGSGRTLEAPIRKDMLISEAHHQDILHEAEGKPTRDDYLGIDAFSWEENKHLTEERIKIWEVLTDDQRDALHPEYCLPNYIVRSNRGIFRMKEKIWVYEPSECLEKELLEYQDIAWQLIEIYFDPAAALRESRGTHYLEEIVGKKLADPCIHPEDILIRNKLITSLEIKYNAEAGEDQTKLAYKNQINIPGREYEIEMINKASLHVFNKLKYLSKGYSPPNLTITIKSILGEENEWKSMKSLRQIFKDLLSTPSKSNYGASS